MTALTVTAADLHPVYGDLVARLTPGDLPDHRALLPHEARLRMALSALTAVVAEHAPTVAGRWVVCAGCTGQFVPDEDTDAMWVDAIVPCRTLRAIVGDHGYGLAIRDADWAAANTAMLRAAGRSDTQVTQAAVLAAVRAEDAPIYAEIAEQWPTGTEPTDRTETPA